MVEVRAERSGANGELSKLSTEDLRSALRVSGGEQPLALRSLADGLVLALRLFL